MYNKIVKIWIYVLLIAGIFLGITGTIYAEQIPANRLPILQIPEMSKPPVINGKIYKNQWKEAVAISGIANQADNFLYPRPTTWYLGWNSNHIYIACKTWVMPDYILHVYGRRPGTADVFDDSEELGFQPLGKNVPVGSLLPEYKFSVNGFGYSGNYAKVAVGQIFSNWSPKFKTAAYLSPVGSAPEGGRWLEITMSATTRDFQLNGPNRTGDRWNIMLGFDQLDPLSWLQARIPCNTSYFDPSGWISAVLARNIPAVHVTMDKLPGFCDGTAAVQFNIYNSTTQTVNLSLIVRVKDKTGDIINDNKDIIIQPGKTSQFILNEKLVRQPKNQGTIYYQVHQGNSILFRYFTYFKVGYPKAEMTAIPAKTPFSLSISFNPIRKNILIKADSYFLKNPNQAKKLLYKIIRNNTNFNRTVLTGSINKKVTYYFKKLIQVPDISPGSYTLEAEIQMVDGKIVGPVKKTFKKLDDAKIFSVWWNNDLGPINKIIPPFTGVRLTNNVVSVWGRKYDLDMLGLPEGIISQGKQILAEPAKIVVVINGKKQDVSLSGHPEWTENKIWQIGFKGHAQIDGLKFQSSGWVEQDGLVYVKLKYSPMNKNITIDSLRIEYPVNSNTAECLTSMGTGANFAPYTAEVLPDRQGELWSTLVLGRTASGMTVGSFFPEVWLGREKRGFLWWADNDKGWVPENKIPAHQVVRRGNAVILINNIIGTPVILNNSRTIIFSYNASPFRPLPKGWRSTMAALDGSFRGTQPTVNQPLKYKIRLKKNGEIVSGWDWLSPPSHNPKEWPSILAVYKKRAYERWHPLQPFNPAGASHGDYVGTSLPLESYSWGSMSGETKVVNYFAPAWNSNSSDTYDTSEIDYALYLINMDISRGGLRSLYWDIDFPTLGSSIQTGIGYKLPDGRIQPGYNGFNTRMFLMRCYSLLSSYGLEPGGQVVHTTNDYQFIDWPWIDAALDGEWAWITDNQGLDWVDVYPVARMRAMSNPHNFGVPFSWLYEAKLKRQPEAALSHRGATDYLRLFDTWRWHVWNSSIPLKALLWGIDKQQTQYIPFWSNSYVACKNKDILISMWRLPHKVMLEIFNDNKENTYNNIEIKIDLQKLGLIQKLPHQEFIRVYNMNGYKNLGIPHLAQRLYRNPPPVLHYYKRILTIPRLLPHTGMLLGISRF
jgi:hypothetical protein